MINKNTQPARKFFALPPVSTTSEVIARASAKKESAEAAAQEKRTKLKRAIGKATAVSAVILAATHPAVHEAADKVTDTVVAPIEWANDRHNQDRVFNPERGNPPNTQEIVESQTPNSNGS